MASTSPADESPTQWVERLRCGHDEAAQKLWQEYFQQLVRLARMRMQTTARRAADEEDVALSAFHSFCRGIENGRYPQIANRDDLWRLLVTITLNKVFHAVRDAGRQKRGGGWKLVDLADKDGVLLEELVGREPTPEFAAQIAEQVEHLLGRLNDQTLFRIAVWKMEGYTQGEIAERLNVAERTIERKVRLIRAVWEAEAEKEITDLEPS
jgi:DNA-directed RNA polymerase specialized sigma24 family protein